MEHLPQIQPEVRVGFDTQMNITRMLLDDRGLDQTAAEDYLLGGLHLAARDVTTYELRYGLWAGFDDQKSGRLVSLTAYDFLGYRSFIRALTMANVEVKMIEVPEPPHLFEEPPKDRFAELVGQKLVQALLQFEETELPALIDQAWDNDIDDLQFTLPHPALCEEERIDLQLRRRAVHEELQMLYST